MARLTISRAMGWKKILKERLDELTTLRNSNSHVETRFLGANAVPSKRDPVYDVVALDKVIGGIWKELRKLDECIKATNALTEVEGYEQDDGVLGELTPAAKPQ
jgi:hypothetical protein